jgi:hypothetical protein
LPLGYDIQAATGFVLFLLRHKIDYAIALQFGLVTRAMAVIVIQRTSRYLHQRSPNLGLLSRAFPRR